MRSQNFEPTCISIKNALKNNRSYGPEFTVGLRESMNLLDEYINNLYRFQTKMLALVNREGSYELAELEYIGDGPLARTTNNWSWGEVDEKYRTNLLKVTIVHTGETFESPITLEFHWIDLHRNNLLDKVEYYEDDEDLDSEIIESITKGDVIVFSTDSRPEFGIVREIYVMNDIQYFEVKLIEEGEINNIDHILSSVCRLATKSLVDDVMVRKLAK